MVTGSASGALRQEFRELEILNEISRLRFEGKLHQSVIGATRNELIKSFREWKGVHYVPQVVHKAIRWSSKDPLGEPEIQDLPWQIAHAAGKHSTSTTSPSTTGTATQSHSVSRKNTFVPAEGSLPIGMKLSTSLRYSAPHSASDTPDPATAGPTGLEWRLNSCAYDSVLTILYAVWESDPTRWTAAFDNVNTNFLGRVAQGFAAYSKDVTTLETV
ncbi:hypothetical protein BD779DRAFT_1443621, partial [Infundibulicybe gibba]